MEAGASEEAARHSLEFPAAAQSYPELLPLMPASKVGPALLPEPDQAELDRRLISHELEIARRIQQSLLPKTLPSFKGFGLAGFCRSARQVGGDLFDVLALSADSRLLLVADVMGKGVPAALFAATLRTLVRTISEWTRHPSELLARMNRLMFEELADVDMFITVQAVVVDMSKNELILASAGHCPLLVARGTDEIRALSPRGLPLGISPGSSFQEETVPLGECSCAMLYTDGLTEMRNDQGAPYGQPRLETWMRKNAGINPCAEQLKEKLLAELRAFQPEGPQDDQTFLLLTREEHPLEAHYHR
jgi:serine phosphatase RsbU (regulator of sigma subunit)